VLASIGTARPRYQVGRPALVGRVRPAAAQDIPGMGWTVVVDLTPAGVA
jgi:hypothetical protein